MRREQHDRGSARQTDQKARALDQGDRRYAVVSQESSAKYVPAHRVRCYADGNDAHSSKSNQQAANLSKVIAKVKESLGGSATPQTQFNSALPRIKNQQARAGTALLQTGKKALAAMSTSRKNALDPGVKSSLHQTIDKYF